MSPVPYYVSLPFPGRVLVDAAAAMPATVGTGFIALAGDRGRNFSRACLYRCCGCSVRPVSYDHGRLEIFAELTRIGSGIGSSTSPLGICLPATSEECIPSPGRPWSASHAGPQSRRCWCVRAAARPCVVVSGGVDPVHGWPVPTRSVADLCRLLADRDDLSSGMPALSALTPGLN